MRIFAGDSADGEKFAEKMGPELMKTLAEGFEEICEKALPSTTHDAIIDAYDTNLMVNVSVFYFLYELSRKVYNLLLRMVTLKLQIVLGILNSRVAIVLVLSHTL
jgi:hypothetical protein